MDLLSFLIYPAEERPAKIGLIILITIAGIFLISLFPPQKQKTTKILPVKKYETEYKKLTFGKKKRILYSRINPSLQGVSKVMAFMDENGKKVFILSDKIISIKEIK